MKPESVVHVMAQIALFLFFVSKFLPPGGRRRKRKEGGREVTQSVFGG